MISQFPGQITTIGSCAGSNSKSESVRRQQQWQTQHVQTSYFENQNFPTQLNRLQVKTQNFKFRLSVT